MVQSDSVSTSPKLNLFKLFRQNLRLVQLDSSFCVELSNHLTVNFPKIGQKSTEGIVLSW